MVFRDNSFIRSPRGLPILSISDKVEMHDDGWSRCVSAYCEDYFRPLSFNYLVSPGEGAGNSRIPSPRRLCRVGGMKILPVLFLGIVLLVGCGGVLGAEEAPSAAQILSWRKAAEQGDAKAQWLLGYCYAQGYGVAKDATEAAKWCRKSAEQGFAAAQSGLGYCYAKGNGVAKDYTEAVKWFRKAAEQGYDDAQFLLGACYANGEGVAKDDVIAYMWYNLAAASGNEIGSEVGKNLREILEKRMTGDQIAEAQRLSREWKPLGE